MKKLLLIIGATLALFAAKPIIIGSGGQGGNYNTVTQDIVDYCGDKIKKETGYDVVNQATHGSVDNLNGLLKKKYSIGFVQEDVYLYFKKKDQLGVIETNTKPFMNLYPEYLHILIPVGWKPVSSGGLWSTFASLFSSSNKQISIMSLKNQTVYAQGGAIVSAQALSYFMGLNLNVVDASHTKTISGPFIFVTGSGDPRIQKMLNTGKWFLLNFNGNELANRSSVYKPAILTYIINGKSITVNTVNIMSKAYERNYRGKKRKSALNKLKQCIADNIDDLIDDGNSDKWSIIAKTNGWQGD